MARGDGQERGASHLARVAVCIECRMRGISPNMLRPSKIPETTLQKAEFPPYFSLKEMIIPVETIMRDSP